MSEAPAYEELFARNLGIFTPEQQERIRSLKVAIAGCGGLGAPCAVLLARMGVGELRLADPEVFEPSNVNRQWGAYLDTIGVNKAAATAAEVARITPYTRAVVFDEGVTVQNVARFLDGVDAVIDGTEFFAFAVQALLHTAARQRGLWVYSAQGAMEIHTLFAFDPAGGGRHQRLVRAQRSCAHPARDRGLLPGAPRGGDTRCARRPAAGAFALDRIVVAIPVAGRRARHLGPHRPPRARSVACCGLPRCHGLRCGRASVRTHAASPAAGRVGDPR